MKYLLDANVVFGALTEAHPQHRQFRRWVAAHRDEGLGICAEVRLAYVRLSMNPEVMSRSPLSAEEAWRVLEDFIAGVAPGAAASGMPREEFISRAEKHRDVQDFYLVQLAADAGSRLATHDARLCRQWPQLTRKVE